MEKTLKELFQDHQTFARNQFPDSTWESSLRGLKREIKEVKLAKSDYSVMDCAENRENLGIEYVDCFMYLLDSMKRAGFDVDELEKLFATKLAINKERQWNKNPDNSYSHKK